MVPYYIFSAALILQGLMIKGYKVHGSGMYRILDRIQIPILICLYWPKSTLSALYIVHCQAMKINEASDIPYKLWFGVCSG